MVTEYISDDDQVLQKGGVSSSEEEEGSLGAPREINSDEEVQTPEYASGGVVSVLGMNVTVLLFQGATGAVSPTYPRRSQGM